MNSQRSRFMPILAAVLICLIPVAGHALEPFSQDFEGLSQQQSTALGNDGWWVYGNVSDPDGTYLYGYGPEPAPNDGRAFCQIVLDEGGLDQGLQQLVVFSDYENLDHELGNIIESNVFQEQVVGPGDVGQTWAFDFQAKMGLLAGSSTALAFIKTLDPGAGYVLTNFLTVDMTSIPITWFSYSLSIAIDPSLEGQILQFGFLNTAADYEPSGIFYDNVNFYEKDLSDVPGGSAAIGAKLGQNYPNPFNPRTRIEFALDRRGIVDVSVFDLAGRRIAALFHGELGTGEHHVVWDGRTVSGAPAPAGQYRYVLKTETEQVSRGMILLK